MLVHTNAPPHHPAMMQDPTNTNDRTKMKTQIATATIAATPAAATATSRSKANRLACLLLVVPLGVVSFSTTAENEITLSNGERTARVRVGDDIVHLDTEVHDPKTRVRLSVKRRAVPDIDAARALYRFFA